MMAKSQDIYLQTVKGPDGEPLVLLREHDLRELARRAMIAPAHRSPGGEFSVREYDLRELVRLAMPEPARQPLEKEYVLPYVSDSEIVPRAPREGVASLLGAEDATDDDAADRAAFEEIADGLYRGEEEIVPAAVANRLMNGESPAAVWRGYRGMTQSALARRTGLSQAMISQIETGKRTGDVETLRKIAKALGILVDDMLV